MHTKTIVIYGPFHFPFGDAGANRVYGIAQALKESGWKIFVVGKGAPREQDKQHDGSYQVEGIGYDTVYQPGERRLSKAAKLLSGGAAYQTVWEQHVLTMPDAVISYGNYILGNFRVRPRLKRRGVPFIVDVVEWYSISQFKRGVLSTAYLDNQSGIRTYRSIHSMIVISSYLERYFAPTVQNLVRVPPLLNTRAITYTTARTGEKLKLFYAGYPSRKDYLEIVMTALATLTTEERARVEFHVYGVDAPAFGELVGVELLQSLTGVVFVHGRVPRSAVLEALLDSDFTVLLRPSNERYANAGFPSKVPESLAAGTPVMLNYTSDLALYIRDGYEGVIVQACTPEAFAEAVRKALALSRAELDAMRIQARQCAEAHFDYRAYVEPLRRFLEKAR